VSKSATVTFPIWVRPAVIHAAEQLRSEFASEENPAEAQEVWWRLVSDSRMKGVWRDLYKKKRLKHKATEEFYYPACVKHASIAAKNRRLAVELREKGGSTNKSEADFLEAEAVLPEDESYPFPDPTWSEQYLTVQLFLHNVYRKVILPDPRWNEQDCAVQLFFHNAYRDALDHELVFLSDLEKKVGKLQGISEQLRDIAAILSSLGRKREARKLRQIASDCDDHASNILPERNSDGSLADDPWIITRRRGDSKVRTFVANLSITTRQLFGRTLYGTLATVTNVAFNRQDITDTKVRDMLRP
jgi:hypothetical protein